MAKARGFTPPFGKRISSGWSGGAAPRAGLRLQGPFPLTLSPDRSAPGIPPAHEWSHSVWNTPDILRAVHVAGKAMEISLIHGDVFLMKFSFLPG